MGGGDERVDSKGQAGVRWRRGGDGWRKVTGGDAEREAARQMGGGRKGAHVTQPDDNKRARVGGVGAVASKQAAAAAERWQTTPPRVCVSQGKRGL